MRVCVCVLGPQAVFSHLCASSSTVSTVPVDAACKALETYAMRVAATAFQSPSVMLRRAAVAGDVGGDGWLDLDEFLCAFAPGAGVGVSTS